MTPTRIALRGGLALAGLVVAAGGAVTMLAPGTGLVVAAGGADRAIAWLILAAAVALLAAGMAAWGARPGSGLAPIAFWAAAAWLAPELRGSESVPREVRALGLLIGPMLVPLLVHLPLRAVRADRGALRVAVAALYLVAAIVAVGQTVTLDPFLLADCLPTCRRDDNPLAVAVDMGMSLGLRSAGWRLAEIGGLGLAGWAVLRWQRRAETLDRMVTGPAFLAGLALVAWGWALVASPRPWPLDPWPVRTTVMLGVAIGLLGAGVAWGRYQEGRRAAGLRELVELLDAGGESGSLRDALAGILHDPTLRVAYPVAEGFVDDQGLPAPAPVTGDGRGVSPVERGAVVVALVEHDAALDPDLLARQVGAAARLAVDNERLAATLRAQVRELQASRQRIVAAGDAARGRLERDLHDGAQQRLLAVSYELRLAAAAAATDPATTPTRRAALDAAVSRIDQALADLRELAHGIWPAVLAEAGLEAALGSLADEAPIPVTLTATTEDRFPAATEAAAYLAVAEALRRAVDADAAGIEVRAERAGTDRLEVEARIPGRAIPGPWLRVDDRAGAAGGRSVVTLDPAAGTRLTVELPCA